MDLLNCIERLHQDLTSFNESVDGRLDGFEFRVDAIHSIDRLEGAFELVGIGCYEVRNCLNLVPYRHKPPLRQRQKSAKSRATHGDGVWGLREKARTEFVQFLFSLAKVDTLSGMERV